jgi:esterase/lipase
MREELCIIIHGFAGNPWEVEPLAYALEKKGYEVMTPLLPGHSLDKAKMEKITSLNWITMIEKIVKQAIEENKKIHMIGFSMGSMIASIMASRYEISTLVLLSPPVYVLTPSVLKTRLGRFFQHTEKKRSVSVHPSPKNQPFIRSIPVYNLFQFQKIVRQAKKIFRHISIPICIIHGLKDEIVDPRSSQWIFRTVSTIEKELHHLPLSKHHICRDCEIDTVVKIVENFLKRHHES